MNVVTNFDFVLPILTNIQSMTAAASLNKSPSLVFTGQCDKVYSKDIHVAKSGTFSRVTNKFLFDFAYE